MITAAARFIRDRWHPLWRLRRSPWFQRVQSACDRTVFFRMPGTDIRVAVRLMRDASWLVGAKMFEPEIRAVLTTLLGAVRPDVFWDVGANIGYYSWFVRTYPSVDQVAMFEPDPTNFSLITATIAKNGILDCHAHEVALSDQEGESAFVVDPVSGAAGSLEQTSHRDNEWALQHTYNLGTTVPCRTDTIDRLIAAGARPPQLIKIDVEGAEHLVIAGGERFFREHRPALVIETTSRAFIEQVQRIGYEPFRINRENWVFVDPSNDRALLAVEKATAGRMQS